MKLLFEIITLVLFFVVYQVYDMHYAIMVVIVAYSLQSLVIWLKYRRLEKMQLITLGLIVGLGGATLFLQNELFFKWKPTVVYGLFAAVLAGSQLFTQKNILQRLGNSTLKLPEHIWVRLNWAWVTFLLGMGALNLFIAYTFSTDIWVYFKLFGALGLLLLFMVAQVALLWRYIEPEEDKQSHG